MFQADDAGSVLDVSALTNLTQQGPWDIDATNGGTLNLGGLTSLTSTQGVSITDTGGSTLLDGELTNLNGVDVTLDGTDTQVAGAWTSFAGSITLTGGSDTLPNVASASFSGLQLDAGSTLDLPIPTADVTDTGDMTIGAGSTLDIAGNLTLTSASTLDEQIGGAPASGLVGQTDVGGSAVLAGTFNLDLVNGFTPSIGQDFAVITFASASGAFSAVNGLSGPGWSVTEALEANSLDLIGGLPPPTFTAATPPAGVANSVYSYQFQATATGGAAITYSATGLPAWAQLNASTGVFTGTPPTVGTFDFSVTASDSVSPSTTVNVALVVAGGTAVTITVLQESPLRSPPEFMSAGPPSMSAREPRSRFPAGTFTGGVNFNVATGAVVDLTGGGTPSYSGTLFGFGGGTVQLASGRLYIGSGGMTLDFDNSTFQWTGGQIDAENGDLTNLGTMTITAPVDFYNDGVLDNFGTIIQTGTGNLQLGTDGAFPATLINEAGASYLLEGDGGISEISDSGSAPGQTSLSNAGTIQKTAGTGTSYFAVLGSITNTGTIEADSGSISLEPALGISQLVDSTLDRGNVECAGRRRLAVPHEHHQQRRQPHPQRQRRDHLGDLRPEFEQRQPYASRWGQFLDGWQLYQQRQPDSRRRQHAERKRQRIGNVCRQSRCPDRRHAGQRPIWPGRCRGYGHTCRHF